MPVMPAQPTVNLQISTGCNQSLQLRFMKHQTHQRFTVILEGARHLSTCPPIPRVDCTRRSQEPLEGLKHDRLKYAPNVRLYVKFA
jgi:hypothetical protein